MSSKSFTDFITSSDLGFSYQFSPFSEMNEKEYEEMQRQEGDYFLPGVIAMQNGAPSIYYSTVNLQRLSSVFPMLKTNQKIQLIQDLAVKLAFILDSDVFNILNIVPDPSWMFYNADKDSLRLLYIPTLSGIYSDKRVLESTLKQGLLELLQGSSEDSDLSLIILADELADPELDLNYFKSYLPEKTLLLKPMSVLRMQHSIEITKVPFLLGRKEQEVNGVITGSRLVGRVHCKIDKSPDGYTITDLDSTNGTRLNGVRLEPNREYPIGAGDQISIANIEFEASMK